MAVYRQIAQFMVKEHKYKGIQGDLLTIGRQKVALTPDQAARLIEHEGLPVRDVDDIELDGRTLGSVGKTVSCSSFFALFTDCTVSAMDITDYEGAEVIHDLTEPLPESLENSFDFVYDGGSLDNLFDPALAIKSYSRMLRPGGRVVIAQMGCFYPSAYLMYSPDWFFDYYVVNGFVDCKVYVALFDEMEGTWTILSWNPLYKDVYSFNELQTDRKVMVISIAEKGAESTWEKSPVQTHYRPDEMKATYIARARDMLTHDRPVFHTGFVRDKDGNTVSIDHPCYTFCGFF